MSSHKVLDGKVCGRIYLIHERTKLHVLALLPSVQSKFCLNHEWTLLRNAKGSEHEKLSGLTRSLNTKARFDLFSIEIRKHDMQLLTI